MKTKVVNKYKESYDVYAGRGSIFGNPYTHLDITKTQAKFQVSTIEEAIEKYKEYFYKKIEEDPEFLRQVKLLKGKKLGCFCAPKPCHVDIIVEFLEKN